MAAAGDGSAGASAAVASVGTCGSVVGLCRVLSSSRKAEPPKKKFQRLRSKVEVRVSVGGNGQGGRGWYSGATPPSSSSDVSATSHRRSGILLRRFLPAAALVASASAVASAGAIVVELSYGGRGDR